MSNAGAGSLRSIANVGIAFFDFFFVFFTSWWSARCSKNRRFVSHRLERQGNLAAAVVISEQ